MSDLTGRSVLCRSLTRYDYPYRTVTSSRAAHAVRYAARSPSKAGMSGMRISSLSNWRGLKTGQGRVDAGQNKLRHSRECDGPTLGVLDQLRSQLYRQPIGRLAAHDDGRAVGSGWAACGLTRSAEPGRSLVFGRPLRSKPEDLEEPDVRWAKNPQRAKFSAQHQSHSLGWAGLRSTSSSIREQR